MNIILVISISLSLNTAFESAFSDPELLFPYMRAVQDTSSPVCVINPALIPCCGGFTATASGGKPYYGYGLSSGFAAAQYGGSFFGLSSRWNSFGDSAYSENSFCAGAGLMPAGWISAGVTADLYRISIDTDNTRYSRRLYDFGAGILLSPASWLQAGFLVRNIRAFKEEQNTIFGEWSCGLLAKPCQGVSLSWNITDTPAGSINTFIVNVNPMKYLSSGFGYSADTSSFSLNLGFMFTRIEINYGLRFHPYLGYSHAVSITYSDRAGTEPLEYAKTVNLPEKRINIQTATYDELAGLGILTDTNCRRIILYREQIGPLSREALAKIGLCPAEIKILVSHTYGLERNVKNGFDRTAKRSSYRQNYMPRKVIVKQRFNEMLNEGIPAYQAALYSDLCVSGGEDFPELLSSDSSLGDEQKSSIRRICGK